MRPTAVEIIHGIRGALAERVLPELTSRYAQAQVMYSMMLLDMLSKEWEEGAHLLHDDNGSMRRLFTRGAEIIEALPERGEELAALAADLRVAVDGPAAPSLRMSDLRAENERLRSLLLRLGEACDDARDDDRLSSLAPLWDEIVAHLKEEAGRRAYTL